MSMKNFTAALGAVAVQFGFAPFDDGVFWSLGHCQGDGCVFEGLLEWDPLIAHLIECDTSLAGYTRACLDNGDCDVKIRRTSHRYSHAHTADMDTDEFEQAFGESVVAAGRVIDAGQVAELTRRVIEAIEARRVAACAQMEKLGYAYFDTCVYEDCTLYVERFGDHTLEIRVVPADDSAVNRFPDFGEVDEHVEWLETLANAGYGQYVTGRLALVHTDDEGDEHVIETLFGGTYDRQAPGEELLEEGWDELDDLREQLAQYKPSDTPADPSPHATEATPLPMAA